MDEIADCLHPRRAGGRALEQPQGDVGQHIRLAIAAAQQKDERLVGQGLDRHLTALGWAGIGQAAIGDDRLGPDAEHPRGRDEARAPSRSLAREKCAMSNAIIGVGCCRLRSNRHPSLMRMSAALITDLARLERDTGSGRVAPHSGLRSKRDHALRRSAPSGA